MTATKQFQDPQPQNHQSIQTAVRDNITVQDDHQDHNHDHDQHDDNIRPTRKRFFILFMYIVLQFIKSFQWICLASVTNVAAKFYQVDNIYINWTAILFMVTFLILALPVSWLMELLGLRKSVAIGSIGITVGVVIKCFSCERDGFLLGMLGHLVVGLSEPFFFSSYSQVASVWFPDTQVAQATSFAIIGEEAGLALGFIIPPMIIGRDPDDMEAVRDGLFSLFVTVAGISVLNTISILLFFDDQPKNAPGIARWKQIEAKKMNKINKINNTNTNNGKGGANTTTLAIAQQQKPSGALDVGHNYIKCQLKQLGHILLDRNFLLLFVGFGLNVGTAYSVHTLLNQMIIKDWHGHEEEDANLVVGNSGLILIVAGLVGSALCGLLLDKFHRHKTTTLSVYLMTLVSMGLLTYSLAYENSQVLYVMMVPLGIALTGYTSCGFDYGVELTYPRAELVSATLLNISAQFFGIPISIFGSYVVDTYGNQALGVFFCLVLTAGFLLTCLQGGDLKRQKAVNEGRRQQTLTVVVGGGDSKL